ncbi:MAG TPA: DUF4082 domain-containing protein [Candidatus Saccharimonadales bacterium]
MAQKQAKYRQRGVKATVVTNTGQGRVAAAVGSRWAMILVVSLFVVMGIGSLIWASAATTTSSLWSASKVPQTISALDSQSVELGLKFKTQYAGKVLGVKFYKGPLNIGQHIGTLWTGDGRKLATADFQNETVTGWQTALFAQPVAITANTTYVVSYHAPSGNYAVNAQYFSRPHVSGDGVLRADSGAGMFTYGTLSAFPATSTASNYWVDVLFSSSLLFPQP